MKLPAGLDPQNTILLDAKGGRIIIKLRNDLAPKHAERIKQLAREGFYNNVPFHRVIAGFMAQTGDGQNGNGTGGSKYPNLKAEFSSRAVHARHRRHGAHAATAEFRQFAILHHVRRRRRPQRPVHRDRAGGVGHGVVDKIKKGSEADNGKVSNPDRIVKMQVAADAK